MNGISRDPEGLDPDLLRLFDAASAHTPLLASDSFVTATILKLRQTARARLIRRCISIGIIMVLTAVLAPYMAEVTLSTVSLVADHLEILVSPIGCVCAALLAWRIAHRVF